MCVVAAPIATEFQRQSKTGRSGGRAGRAGRTGQARQAGQGQASQAGQADPAGQAGLAGKLGKPNRTPYRLRALGCQVGGGLQGSIEDNKAGPGELPFL